MSYIGFIIGTVYQYGLLRLMVDIVFKDVEGVPTYKFDFPVMFISLVCFITIYEILMYVYSEKIKKISIKEMSLNTIIKLESKNGKLEKCIVYAIKI